MADPARIHQAAQETLWKPRPEDEPGHIHQAAVEILVADPVAFRDLNARMVLLVRASGTVIAAPFKGSSGLGSMVTGGGTVGLSW